MVPNSTHTSWIYLSAVVLSLLIPKGRTTALVTLRHHQHGALSRRSREDGGNTTEEAAPSEFLVRQHEEAVLLCEAVNNSGGSVRWRHNGAEVDPGHRYSVDPSSGRLTVSSVRLEDDGTWQCEDRDTGVVARPIWLVVLDPPRPPYLLIDGRRLDPGNLFVPVKENTNLTIECVSEGGSPSPTLQWVLIPGNTQTVEAVPGLQLIKENVTEHQGPGARSKALLRVERAHHNATIACLVHHATLPTPINASLLLDVQYTPSFGIIRLPGFGFPLREGIPVSLKCEVDSNPPSSPVWQKDNAPPPVEQSDDGFLNFTSIRREHGGWYKCTTKHLLGDFSSIAYLLNVRHDVPEMEMTPGDAGVSEEAAVEVSLGGVVQLQCPSKEGGCWGKVGKDGSLDPVGPGPGLHVDRILYQEAGEYRCVVARSAKLEKYRSHNVHVSVVGGPAVYPSNKTVTVATGDRTELAVEFCANPPHTKAFWINQDRVFTPGRIPTPDGIFAHKITEGPTAHCYVAVLELTCVQPTDHGEYMFLVVSDKGVSQASIHVNVTMASGLQRVVVSWGCVSTLGLALLVRSLAHLLTSPGDLPV
ncbi:protein turtle homolog B-like isoform X2 [Macrosteles quadrilineatus]|uniref:protein turtle homolog B-like isoform X2 n=1 Tax=Macrosteles quadrilineatus TaxID=74068 RepID=UPI0023E18AE6|nr:protein turtle homolog B-like isoform X2 [Macrosteles quadrilineatus]